MLFGVKRFMNCEGRLFSFVVVFWSRFFCWLLSGLRSHDGILLGFLFCYLNAFDLIAWSCLIFARFFVVVVGVIWRGVI